MRRRGQTTSTLRALPSLLIDQPPDARLTSRDGPAAVMWSEWRDPADTSPNAARTARTITGYRGSDPLRRCRQRHGDTSSISERHIVAADILRGTVVATGAR